MNSRNPIKDILLDITQKHKGALSENVIRNLYAGIEEIDRLYSIIQKLRRDNEAFEEEIDRLYNIIQKLRRNNESLEKEKVERNTLRGPL